MKLTTQAMRLPGPSRQMLNGRALHAQRAPTGTSSGTKLLILVFLLTIFEEALRKWVVSGSPLLRYGIYFSKDIVFAFHGASQHSGFTLDAKGADALFAF